jgi:regulator of RNase E activity RraB
MTDRWDFYFLRVDDKPASIYLDLGAHESAPNPKLTHMAYVRLHMREARDDGLSSQTEFDALNAVEDALTAALVNEETNYVGRCTADFYRDFFFYVSQAQDWSSRVAACMRSFGNYRYEAGAREEPDWATYFSLLYPSDTDMESIENRHICEALERKGDKLSEAREIDHWAYFADKISLDAYVAEARQLGFKVREIRPPDDTCERHCAQLWRSDIPAFNAIDAVTLPLFNLAAKHGGEYDGWETFVVT